MFRLEGHVKTYDWGSTSAIQRFAGLGEVGAPLAEVWFGAHPSGPSHVAGRGDLDDLLRHEPRLLGDDVADRFGELPFLMKLLAPGRAVSLQVHPSLERARDAFGGEGTGAATFVDANHKPEMIFALTSFDGLVGLRPFADAIAVLRASCHPVLDGAASAAESAGDLRPALRVLAGSSAGEVRSVVAALSERRSEQAAFATLAELAEQYPDDAGPLVSLVLDRVSLEPGDAVFVDSGVPHAYISGLAVEIMANSDNVFRLGLTSKEVDVDESLRNLITAPAQIIRAASGPGSQALMTRAEEFVLTVHRGTALRVDLGDLGPRVVLSGAGRTTLTRNGSDEEIVLSPGDAAFVGHGESGRLIVDGHAVVGSVPR